MVLRDPMDRLSEFSPQGHASVRTDFYLDVPDLWLCLTSDSIMQEDPETSRIHAGNHLHMRNLYRRIFKWNMAEKAWNLPLGLQQGKI